DILESFRGTEFFYMEQVGIGPRTHHYHSGIRLSNGKMRNGGYPFLVSLPGLLVQVQKHSSTT
ncbi:hypothetical protein Dimus_030075, partial [Dionaea muscipula]